MKTYHPQSHLDQPRKGAFMVLAFFCLVVCTSFVAFSVDIGYLNLAKTEMQNAVDSAALAAAQEISAAVQNAPQGTTNVNVYANGRARLEARDVAQLNGFYIDPDTDVRFGLRSFNASSGQFEVTWDVTPSNVVKVTARKTNDDLAAADSKLKLFFSGVAGDGYAKIQAEAVAFVESRDIVVVHDFSRSMNFDSYFNNEANKTLSDAAVLANMQLIWSDLNKSLGSLAFAPQYLNLSNTSNGTTTSATFKYNVLAVSTDGTLNKVKLTYTDNSTATFTNVSGASANVTGTKDIKLAEVTTNKTVNVPAVPGNSQTMSDDGITIVFSADRKSYSISGSRPIYRLKPSWVSGGSSTFDLSTPYPTSTSRNESSAVSKIVVYYQKSGSNTNKTFDCSEPDPGTPATTEQVETVQTFEDSDANVLAAFGLTNVPYPYAQGSWTGSAGFITYCRNGTHSGYNTCTELTSRGYREMYGGMPFVDYILRYYSGYWQTNDIWKTRHYPFHAIKEGHDIFCDFLNGLGFDDQLGMVSYDKNHRIETVLNDPNPQIPYVNISSDPITSDYTAVNNLMKYKQANHYSSSTNMGGGLKDAITCLADHKRPGARSTILLMTDGNTNTIDSGENTSLPSDWDWDSLLDYDGDGNGDYYTNNSQKTYILKKALEAFNQGYTIHTMAVGADADVGLMEAVAHLTNGHFISVPGGTSVSQMETEVRAAFHKIASFVPPARLQNDVQ